VSYPTIWSWSKQGRFPAARSLGFGHDGRVGWLESEVDEWIRSLSVRQYGKKNKASANARAREDA
jgi:predicted DNA-binding transcriptional regulator AlpA